ASSPAGNTTAAPGDPTLGALAVAGGAVDAATIAQRLTKKALVRIRTLGPFRYDYESSVARFEVAARTDPNVPNNVEVTRLNALGQRDYLVCQLLELELDGPLTQGGTTPPAPNAAVPARDRSEGLGFRAVRASGSSVYIFADAEQLEAYGTHLVYQTGLKDPKRPRGSITQTTLTGAPLVAVRQRNKLEAGQEKRPGRLILTSFEPTAVVGKPKPPSESHSFIDGPGRVELFDSATGQTNLRAYWTTSLEQGRDTVGKEDLDLFVFKGNGRFEDPKGDFDLSGDTLRLWLKNSAAASPKGAQPLPFRLQGVGHVASISAHTIIKDADSLNVWFQDVVAPPVVEPVPIKVATAVAPPAPVVVPTPSPMGKVAAPAPVVVAPVPVTEKPKTPPMTLSARAIEAWVSRYPTKATPKVPSTIKYELDRARCEDRVLVTQPPKDATKNPNGTRIVGKTLNITHVNTGHVMNLVAVPGTLAEVHFENVHIAGPIVDIHQPNNTVDVTGNGWLQMPSSTDFNGQDLSKPADLMIQWTDRMKFRGERRLAEFVGQVQAEQKTVAPIVAGQEPTWSRAYALCHRLEVGFDRPVYFNQLRPNGESAPPRDSKENPKVETVVCHPAPEDGDGLQGGPKPAAPVVFADETFITRTGMHQKAQRIVARFLELKTENNRMAMVASGPGESRSLQLGAKDQAIPQTGTPAPAAPGKSPPGDELKLTVVRFVGKLRIKDQKGIFQQAVFEESVRVLNFPTTN
ncbi:MAG: hypothetical protein ACRCZF_09735, partial [Gemmataceae bacterium]